MMAHTERRFAGDVLIVGAGIVGVLLADRLGAAGIESTLVEAVGAGAEQSNHSHGYLHRGHAYLDASPQFLAAFARAHALWEPLLDSLGATPVTGSSAVALADPITRDSVVATWRRAGLPFEPADTPPGFRDGCGTVFRTREPTYDVTGILQALLHRHQGVQTVLGRATRLVHDGRGLLVGAEVSTSRGVVLLAARHVVLAAGTGNPKLVRTLQWDAGRTYVRTSMMMVLHSAGLPTVSAVLPEPEQTGLFVVSRPGDNMPVWLVSNFVSFPGQDADARTIADWSSDICRTLRRVTEVVDLPDLHSGVYLAPKAELRADPRQLNVYEAEDYGIPNLSVLSPTKLTFAPTLVEDVATRLIQRLPQLSSTVRLPRWEFSDELPVLPERWRQVALAPLDLGGAKSQ
jgi:glycine/D-amino acid oxidase-like deaminating enzyme